MRLIFRRLQFTGSPLRCRECFTLKEIIVDRTEWNDSRLRGLRKTLDFSASSGLFKPCNQKSEFKVNFLKKQPRLPAHEISEIWLRSYETCMFSKTTHEPFIALTQLYSLPCSAKAWLHVFVLFTSLSTRRETKRKPTSFDYHNISAVWSLLLKIFISFVLFPYIYQPTGLDRSKSNSQ